MVICLYGFFPKDPSYNDGDRNLGRRRGDSFRGYDGYGRRTPGMWSSRRHSRLLLYQKKMEVIPQPPSAESRGGKTIFIDFLVI